MAETPREPDRFDAQARGLWTAWRNSDPVGTIAAALRAEHASALERAAQVLHAEATNQDRYAARAAFSEAESLIRALIPPAAAPAAETRNDPCQRCGRLGGHPVDFRFDGISMSSWLCPHCLVAQEKRLAELETALVKIRDGCGYGLGHDIPWVRDVAKSALAARVARIEGPK